MTQRERTELLAIVGSDDSMVFLRRRLESLGLSAAKLARLMSVDPSQYEVSDETVRRWLRGETDPGLDDVRRMAAVLAGHSPKGRLLSSCLLAPAHQTPWVHPFGRHRRRIADLPPIRAEAA